jgi:hypothetical protein
MKSDSQLQVGASDVEDDVARLAMLARKATRKASRAANKVGYFVDRADGTCVVKSPKNTVTIEVETTPVDVKKHYTFARSAP